MAKIAVELVTPDSRVLAASADFVRAPGATGELGILPRHTPLVTTLRAGEIMVRTDGREQYLFVAGGLLHVMPDRVAILADAAERAEDIDQARARRAGHRAQRRLHEPAPGMDSGRVTAALERASLRLRIAELRNPGGTRRT